MRFTIIVVAVVILSSCVDNVNKVKAPVVCTNLTGCLISGTWTSSVQAISKGSPITTAGGGGVITFKRDNTGTTTESYIQAYENGAYRSDFTYVVDQATFKLTISYAIAATNPTQTAVYTVTAAYEDNITMETPFGVGDGKLIFTLKK
jgi:hypothetical protein